MVVGSPGIMADTSYDVINMAPVKSLIWGKFIIFVSIGDSLSVLCPSKVDIA